MIKHQLTILHVVFLTLFTFYGGVALADVVGAMSAAGSELILWIRAGGIIVVIIMALSMLFGRINPVTIFGGIAGLAIATQPEPIAALIMG